jgi:hypothetical protein
VYSLSFLASTEMKEDPQDRTFPCATGSRVASAERNRQIGRCTTSKSICFILVLRYRSAPGLRRVEGDFIISYPALTPHPGKPGLGDVPGYYQTSLAGLDLFGLHRFHISKFTIVNQEQPAVSYIQSTPICGVG